MNKKKKTQEESRSIFIHPKLTNILGAFRKSDLAKNYKKFFETNTA
jgi:hypothetical protein